MLETIAANSEIDLRGMNLGGWNESRGQGYVRYTLPHLPAGISQVAIFNTPKGASLRIEANLTSLLHGSWRSSGSLHEDEVVQAVAVFIHQAQNLVGRAASPHPELWNLIRWDASCTYQLPPAVPAGLIVRDAADNFAQAVKGRQVAIRYVSNGATAVHQQSKSKLRRVYESAPAAHSAGKCEIGNALRVETQFRPKGKQIHHLDEIGTVVTMAKQEIKDMTALLDQLAHLSAQSTQATAAALIAGQRALGEEPDPREALKLAGIAQIISMEGMSGCIKLGVSRHTVYKWNARIKNLLQAEGEEGWWAAQPSLFGDEAVVFARDLLDHEEAGPDVVG
jgi:hypothetical protein